MTELPLFLNRCISWRLFRSIWAIAGMPYWILADLQSLSIKEDPGYRKFVFGFHFKYYDDSFVYWIALHIQTIESMPALTWIYMYTHTHSHIDAVILLYTSHSWVNCKFPSSFCINYLCTSFYGCAKCRDTPPPPRILHPCPTSFKSGNR